MSKPLYFAVPVVFSSLPALGQQEQSPTTCVATEEAVLTAEHELWSARRDRYAAAWNELVDDSFVLTDDGGTRKGKQEIPAGMKKPEGHVHNDTDETPKMFALFLQTALQF